MTGKVLGQFFTQPIVKKMMVNLIDPQIYPDGTIDSCCDPTMGTGGFLITYLQTILQQATEKNITPNWDFIKNQGLYGKEIEPDTYQLAVSNMMISSGHMFECLERGDSIRVPITRKFDNILANPPFGIKGLKYDGFRSSIKNEYTPIKTDNAVSLFIQAIIYMLNIGGKCAVVLPDGQDLFSKTNASLVAIREYLFKTCDLKEVIYLPSGIFTYTSIKTCIFYLIKKVEGTEVLKTTVKMTKKTNKISGYKYEFSKELQTTEVAFYNYNSTTEDKTLLVTVSVDDIVKNSYSLNYAEYMKNDNVAYDNSVVVKTLGEVCEFKNGKAIKRDELIEGQYPVIGGGQKPMGFHNKYNTEANIVLCASSGSAGYISKYDKQVWASDCFSIIPKNGIVNNSYMYYFLKSVQDKIYEMKTGVAQPHVYSRDIQLLKIPIPSIERQQKIVEYLDFIYETSNKASIDKIANLKKANEYAMSNQINYGKNEVKTLGEVCDINPENMKSGQYSEINYIDITSVKGGEILSFQKLDKDYPSRAKRIVKKGDILYSSVRPNLKGYVYISNDIENAIASTGFAHIRVKDKTMFLSKYIYYVLTSEYVSDMLINKAKGAQYPSVSFDDFNMIEIHIPSLERQKELVKYCEGNDKLIFKLEKEIERNLKEASAMINSIGN